MERLSDLSFRTLEPESDLDLLVELMPKSFPELQRNSFPLREWLSWKYSPPAKPHGSTIGYVFGTQSSFYGILQRNYTINRKQLRVGLVVDVMTVPEARGKGLFVETARSALSGLQGKSVAFTIGFPIRKDVMPGHQRLAWKAAFPLYVYVAPIGRANRKSLTSMVLGAFRLLLPRVANAHLKATHTSDLNTFLDATREIRETRVNTGAAQIDKSDEFLHWRLAQPDAKYEFIALRDGASWAYAVCRVASLKGTRTLAVVDIDGSDPSSVRDVVRSLTDLAITSCVDILVVCTNPSNAKRLGLLRSGLFRTPLKFTTILRDVSDSSSKITEISESQWRVTWLDSDTL